MKLITRLGDLECTMKSHYLGLLKFCNSYHQEKPHGQILHSDFPLERSSQNIFSCKGKTFRKRSNKSENKLSENVIRTCLCILNAYSINSDLVVKRITFLDLGLSSSFFCVNFEKLRCH